MRVLRAFRKEQEEIAEFSRRNRLLNQLQLRVGRISNLLNPVTYVILNLAVVALLRTGALRVNSGALTQGKWWLCITTCLKFWWSSLNLPISSLP